MKKCIEKNYFEVENKNDSYALLPAGQKLQNQNKVDGALIIAAGFN